MKFLQLKRIILLFYIKTIALEHNGKIELEILLLNHQFFMIRVVLNYKVRKLTEVKN